MHCAATESYMQIMGLLLKLILLLYFARSGYSFKVVIFVPTLSNSQLVFNYRIGDLLTSAGHDVTMYRPQYNPDALKGSSNLTNEIRFRAYDDEKLYGKLLGNIGSQAFGSNKLDINMMFKFMDIMTHACELQISNNDLMGKLAGENFDIALVHQYDFCPMGIVRALKIPTHIWMSSGMFMDHMAWYSGSPIPSSYVPNTLSAMSDRMTYFERMKNLIGACLLLPIVELLVNKPQTALFRKHFGQEFPSMDNLARNSPLLFINSIEFLDFPRPILHKIIYMGGIGMKKPKKLETNWQRIMDNSKDGVILLSMGSVINSTLMPHHLKMSFLNAFSNFPNYTFIWKYEDAANFSEAKEFTNVHLSAWVPQTDLFGHPKMRAFISHGGANSFTEAAYTGVPLVAMPLFGDQFGNMRRAERHGIGAGLDRLTASSQTITETLKRVLDDPSYLKNAKRMGSMLRKKPIKSEDLVVKWVEFLAEYKELPNLQPAANELRPIQYFGIDVILGLVSGIFLVVYVFYRVVLCCCSIVCGRRSGKKKRD